MESRKLTSRDYRLFDIQHCVLPTRLPLEKFYVELVKTQRVMNMKHLGWSALWGASAIAARRLSRGQTNFVKMLWKFNSVYDKDLLLADHQMPVAYEMSPPPLVANSDEQPSKKSLYVHVPRGRRGRAIDDASERFVDETREGVEA